MLWCKTASIIIKNNDKIFVFWEYCENILLFSAALFLLKTIQCLWLGSHLSKYINLILWCYC